MRSKWVSVWLASAGAATLAVDAAGEGHWAFQPIVRPEVPAADASDPVSWFVTAQLASAGLPAAPPAERSGWVRRLIYNLTGLPPEFATIQALVGSTEDDATLARRLVDDLLASPRYGERWARHWLDVARYSDTKGYAYSPEEFNFPHAWVYRDWVIKAFNEDLPYDRFVQRQLAADLLLERGEASRGDLAAMGFLTLGQRFIGVEPDIIDDRIDVTTRGLLGLTVSCSRCHDHKFDPVPTADYYALYGMFKSSREDLQPVDPAKAEGQAGLETMRAAFAAEFEKQAGDFEGRFLERTADYLLAALDIAAVPPPDFAEVIEAGDLNPAQTRRWYEYLSQEERRDDPVFAPWRAIAEGRETDLATANPIVREALQEHGGDPEVMARCYAELFKRAAGEEGENDSPEWRELRAVVSGPASPIRIPRDYLHDVEWLFTEEVKTALKKQQAAIEGEILKLGESAPHALALVDRPAALNVRIFERGQYPNQLAEVPRGSLGIGNGGQRPAYTGGSGRLEFAREITARNHPLTARVIANRIWAVHFGEGLVRTESDFGLRSEPPSHPELLDFLAVELIESGWSIKHLQRLIATSAVYRRQAGMPPVADAENRLLSVYPRRRLDVEAMRDSMLAASGELDLRMGGPAGELFGAGASPRRSIYGRIDRQFLASTLSVFDFANPELHTPRRYRTNVPQQALFLMNAPFTVARAKALAARVAEETGPGGEEDRVRRIFELVYARDPDPAELAGSLEFVTTPPPAVVETPPDPAAEAWSYGYGTFDPGTGRLAEFQILPHFTGEAWGGGDRWPDEALGWVRLTAQGGHAGNDRAHAAVRRWTAPAAGTVDVSGTIAKIQECGDGLRAWVASSRQGLLAAWVVEFGTSQAATIEKLNVQTGETLDFVIDCGEADNFLCDGFTWAPVIGMAGGNGGLLWDAAANFAGTESREIELGNWERLAQALLISNEAMFLD